MDLTSRKAAAAARLEQAKSALSDGDLSEIAERAEIDKLEDEAKAEESKRRELELARRLDSAREALGPDAGLEAVAIIGFPDTFIVRRDGKAHAKWHAAMIKSHRPDSKIEPLTVSLTYAVAVVHDWNGNVRDDNDAEFTHKLTQYLTANPGIVTPITDVAGRLAGVFAEEFKR